MELAKVAARVKRRRNVEECAASVCISPALCERNAVILAYIYDNVGDQSSVLRACLEEKEALEARRGQSGNRHAELIEELRTHGLTLNNDRSQGLAFRSDSRFCSEFISGETNASVEEVVATMKMTHHLLNYSHRVLSRFYDSFKAGMWRMVRTGEATGWYDAYQRVFRESSVQIAEYVSDDFEAW